MMGAGTVRRMATALVVALVAGGSAAVGLPAATLHLATARHRLAAPSTSGASSTFGDLTVATGPGQPVRLSRVRYLRVDGMRLGYRTGGTGPALVMITGPDATLAKWNPRLIGQLEAAHHVVVFDNRDVATSGQSPGRALTTGQRVRGALGLMDKLRIRRADILGWLTGAMVARQVAIDTPGRVLRLVLCVTGPADSPARRYRRLHEIRRPVLLLTIVKPTFSDRLIVSRLRHQVLGNARRTLRLRDPVAIGREIRVFLRKRR